MPTCPICGAEIAEGAVCRKHLARSGGASRTVVSKNWLAVLAVVLLFAAFFAALIAPAIQQVRSGRRSPATNNIRNLALSVHNYHDAHDSLPLAPRHQGAPAHGWQTHMLPYLEQSRLYETIDFARVWDDPANAAAFRTEVEAFIDPGASEKKDARGYPLFHYAGNVHVLGRVPALKFGDIRDGTTNTILMGEIGEGPRAWGDPASLRDPALGLNRGPATFGHPRKHGGVNFGSLDGAVYYLYGDTSLEVLEALATPAGGEEMSFP
ncbi:MAG: DUF1559 domain-containing protein [Planctomycetaceae bacterium]